MSMDNPNDAHLLESLRAKCERYEAVLRIIAGMLPGPASSEVLPSMYLKLAVDAAKTALGTDTQGEKQ